MLPKTAKFATPGYYHKTEESNVTDAQKPTLMVYTNTTKLHQPSFSWCPIMQALKLHNGSSQNCEHTFWPCKTPVCSCFDQDKRKSPN